jgi:hypothetical protein
MAAAPAAATKQATKDDDGPRSETQQELAARQASAAAIRGEPKPVTVAPATLQAGRVKAAEGDYNKWSVAVDHGVTREDLHRPEFWTHNAKQFRPLDEVRVACVDGSWVAYLLVTAVGPKSVKMQVESFVNLDPVEPGALEIPNGYAVDWGGSIAKFRVKRGIDVIRDGFDQRSQAVMWLGNHLQSMR